MAFNFSVRARKLAWSAHDEKQTTAITRIQRVGTDSTLYDDDDSASISPTIRRIQASEDIDRYVSALTRDGCVIVESFTDLQSLQKVEQEIHFWAQIRNDETSGHSTPLIKQSPTLRNNFVASQLYHELCKDFLTVETTHQRKGRSHKEVCRPILSSADVCTVQSSGAAETLFRHDTALAVKHEDREKYQQGQDAMLGLILPGSGPIKVRATLGSHMCGNESLDFGKDIVEAELEAGDGLIVLGSTYHQIAASSYQEEDDEAASAYAIWSCSGVYRPEEQLALMINAAELNLYPAVIQDMIR